MPKDDKPKGMAGKRGATKVAKKTAEVAAANYCGFFRRAHAHTPATRPNEASP